MKIDDLVTTARDALTTRRVFSEPWTQGNTTVITAARVSGGGGGGGGQDGDGQVGEGGGFGLQARPAGAFVVKDGTVRWMPAVDVNRLASVVGSVIIAFLLTRVRLAKVRAKSRAASQLLETARARSKA